MSKIKPLVTETLTLAVIVAVMHYVALTLFLYWRTEWFDVVMHFAGGFLIGLLAALLFYASGIFSFPREHKGSVFAVVLGSVLVVGLGWELWELFLGFTNVIADQVDTMQDIGMDILGGTAAFLYAKKSLWNKAN
ncbi:MAG: hypothetical protein RL150_699 [Candidatus Parcubacteria bacterium]